MLNVLEVYERKYNPDYPVICLDEKSKQLTKNVRSPIPCKPSKPRKHDYEYERNGTVNLFVAVEPKGKRRVVRVTKRRTKKDYASFVRYLVTKVYKEAERIVLVEDNLNTHTDKALIEILGEEEGKQVAGKIERHHTPVHASWLNQAEIEISALEKQCLKRNIPTFQTMQSETAACVRKRNKDKIGIDWQFTRKKARKKFHIA
jgi:transposase